MAPKLIMRGTQGWFSSERIVRQQMAAYVALHKQIARPVSPAWPAEP